LIGKVSQHIRIFFPCLSTPVLTPCQVKRRFFTLKSPAGGVIGRRLDVVFREDAARVSRSHAPENLNILPFTAAMNPGYMHGSLWKANTGTLVLQGIR
jgi:hypothetical protein